MDSLLEILSTYVPGVILRRLAASPELPTGPEESRFPAAVLFADISGFTQLTEDLARKGPEGAEELTQVLNSYFGALIATITTHGGDVVKFAGDAVLAVWRAEDDLKAAVALAAQCGLDTQEKLTQVAAEARVRLSMRVAIGAGEVLTAQLGGIDDSWELLVAGAPLLEVGLAGRYAQPGDVVVAGPTWDLMGEEAGHFGLEHLELEHPAVGTLLQRDTGGTPVYRLESLRKPARLSPTLGQVERPRLDPAAETALRTYIPRAILSRLDAGQTGWLAELRRISVLFVSLPGLAALAISNLEQAQAILRAAQSTVFRFEGTINKLSVDDKGASLVAAFGLPPLAHEDDAVRAVLAARALHAELAPLGIRCSIGVTTGRAFCGGIGSKDRREYTVMGDVVNVSARLMQAAGDGLLCDETTFQAASSRLSFDALPKIPLKGKAEPVAVYRPRGESKVGARTRRVPIGRTEELERFDVLLGNLTAGSGGVMVVSGEAGMGKSCLIEELIHRAGGQAIRTFIGGGEAIEKSTSYRAWRGIFIQAFELEPHLDDTELRNRVLARLADQPDLLRLAPLLNAVLPLDLPDNEVTEQMTGQARADNIRDLLLRVLEATAAQTPLLVVLEDAHWLDSASWALALHVSQRAPNISLAISSRPLAEPLQAEVARLLNAPGTQRMQLEPLPPADTVALVCQSLGVEKLPDAVVALIREKADGHPFFSEELAFALRDAGVIQIVGYTCHIAPGVDMRSVNLPDTVQGVITSRIDRLEPSPQLVLKVASVIGRTFSVRLLRAVHPIESDRAQLPEHVETLQNLGLTPLEAPEPDLTYVFKHAITQDVAYNLMSFAQRRQLHRRVAEWYEQIEADHLAPFYPVLAHHWGLAEEDEKTFEYLEKAGEQAYRTGADLEACVFFERALALYEKRGGGRGQEGSGDLTSAITPSRRGRWERFLGDARFGLGDVAAVCYHSTNALTLLGEQLPASQTAWTLRTLSQLVRHIGHVLMPRWGITRQLEVVDRRLEAARAAERLAEVFYFQNDPLKLVSVTLLAANLAASTGRLAPASRSLALMGMLSGMARLHNFARRYFKKAIRITQEAGDLRGLATGMYYEGVYLSAFAEWAEVDRVSSEALVICRQIGVNFETGICLTILGLSAYFTGRFDAGRGHFVELLNLARACGNVQHEAWGHYTQAECLIAQGRLEEAVALLEPARALLADHSDLLSQILVESLLALAWLRMGELELARRAADAALDRNRKTVPNNWASLEGYTGSPEVYLALWEEARGTNASGGASGGAAQGTSGGASGAMSAGASGAMSAGAAGGAQGTSGGASSKECLELSKLAASAILELQKFAGLYPIGRPRFHLHQGRAAWLSEKPRAARRAWKQSLSWARKLGMPYEEAQAHFELWRHGSKDHPARAAHREQALELFRRLGCAWHLKAMGEGRKAEDVRLTGSRRTLSVSR